MLFNIINDVAVVTFWNISNKLTDYYLFIYLCLFIFLQLL